MGVHLQLVDFDDLFFKKGRVEPIIINDFNESSEEERDAFNQKIYTRYCNDLLSNLPSCECGEIVGEHNAGVKCQACGTVVQTPLEQKLESLVWMRAPDGVKALINPLVWTQLSHRFTISGFNIIQWICDTTYNPPNKIPAVVAKLQAAGIIRGYNNFIEHFDSILNMMFSMREFNKGKKIVKGKLDPLQEELQNNKSCVFSQFIPLPNRTLLVIDETNVGIYADPVMVSAINAIRTMVSIDAPMSSHSLRTKENRTVKTLAEMSEFYDGIYRTMMATKEGVFRKHVFGTRSHWSGRAVISSLTDKHKYSELHIPWGIGVTVLRVHLFNKLLRRDYTPNGAIAFLNAFSQKYHPLLDELFTLLIAESPYIGIPVVFQRNPSLERGSAQTMFITHVKTNVDIPTISTSIMSVVGFNAD